MAKRKVLFFIKSTSPTAAERKAGEALGAYFRNASLVGNTVEKCDAVAGLVPKQYKELKGVEVLKAKDGKKANPLD